MSEPKKPTTGPAAPPAASGKPAQPQPAARAARPTGPAAPVPRVKLPGGGAGEREEPRRAPLPEGARSSSPALGPQEVPTAAHAAAPPASDQVDAPSTPAPAPAPSTAAPAATAATAAAPTADPTAGLPEPLPPIKSSFFARWRPRATRRTGEVVAAGMQQAMEGRPPVVLFRGVSKVYYPGTPREFTAIKDVSFSVDDLPDEGEFVAVLGPSGCGKSTVLRLIAGLEPQHPPTTGRVEIFGKRVLGPGADRGMVFQSYSSFDNRTVLRNVAFGLECRGMGKREREDLARSWIEKVGLSVKDDAHKYPHQLSGGMQQRVAIARTLALKPRILLMDEPFGALDPMTRLHMQDLLLALWREVQATVFFVTHSIEEAVYLGDRVLIFSRSPGTVACEVKVPKPDRPAMEMQRDPSFQDVVFQIREMVDRFERETAAPRAPAGSEADRGSGGKRASD